jgi:hypothetical protein
MELTDFMNSALLVDGETVVEKPSTVVTFSVDNEMFNDVVSFGKDHASDQDFFEIGAKLMMDFWTPQSEDLDLEG